jgi:cytochrome c oxidase subunit II
MASRPSTRPLAALGLAVGLATPLAALAAWEVNLPRGVTPISREIYDLHMLILWITVAIGAVVFGAMFYSILRHRRSLGVEPAKFHHSTGAEILWTVIPILILVGMAYPATKALMVIHDSSDSDITVKATGYQWLWRYQYLDEGISFYSSLHADSRAAIVGGNPREVENYLLDVDNPVVLPVGKKVRLLLTADDVIHAWWVPELGMKRDAIPGFVNELWIRIDEPGTYRGQCAELCGRDHGFMPIVVVAVPEEEYRDWVSGQQQAASAPSLPATAAVAAAD